MAMLTTDKTLRVEIQSGFVLTDALPHEQGGPRDLSHMGGYRYYVDLVDADGRRLSMVQTSSHEQAVKEASALSAEFGPVHDLSDGGAK